MRSIRQTLRGPSVLPKTQPTTFWRREIHINLKIDADAMNQRRRRFCAPRTVYHIYQGQ
jgi:hypothetical protein